MPHGEAFDGMCADVCAQLAAAPWRAQLPPRTVLILEGIEAGLGTPKIFAACRAMFEDYGPVRVCYRVLFRVFMRMLRKLPRAAARSQPL